MNQSLVNITWIYHKFIKMLAGLDIAYAVGWSLTGQFNFTMPYSDLSQNSRQRMPDKIRLCSKALTFPWGANWEPLSKFTHPVGVVFLRNWKKISVQNLYWWSIDALSGVIRSDRLQNIKHFLCTTCLFYSGWDLVIKCP